jgi:hypothetical protein
MFLPAAQVFAVGLALCYNFAMGFILINLLLGVVISGTEKVCWEEGMGAGWVGVGGVGWGSTFYFTAPCSAGSCKPTGRVMQAHAASQPPIPGEEMLPPPPPAIWPTLHLTNVPQMEHCVCVPV